MKLCKGRAIFDPAAERSSAEFGGGLSVPWAAMFV